MFPDLLSCGSRKSREGGDCGISPTQRPRKDGAPGGSVSDRQTELDRRSDEAKNILELTMLIILGGLPGTGKTAIARELARQLGAVHVRIDSIEEAILDSGVLSSPINDAGYRVGYAVAADNLRIGRTVIADSVNPIPLSRDAWVEVANHAQVSAVEIEVTCSNTKEHQHRVETRISDIPRSRSLTWQEVVSRDYRPWNREHIVIDTANRTVEQVVTILRGAIPKQ